MLTSKNHFGWAYHLQQSTGRTFLRGLTSRTTMSNWHEEESDKFNEGTPENERPNKKQKFGLDGDNAANQKLRNAGALRLTNGYNFQPPTKIQPTSSTKPYTRDVGQSGSTSQNANRKSVSCGSNDSSSCSSRGDMITRDRISDPKVRTSS